MSVALMQGARRARSAGLFLLLGSVLACGVASSVGTADGGGSGAAQAIDSLTSRCSLAMLQGSCRAMKTEPGSSPRPAAARVFVAGFGEIDRNAYEGFRAQGDAMCSTVAQRCREDWQGSACRAARALFPSSPGAAEPDPRRRRLRVTLPRRCRRSRRARPGRSPRPRP